MRSLLIWDLYRCFINLFKEDLNPIFLAADLGEHAWSRITAVTSSVPRHLATVPAIVVGSAFL
jgi:hypothetical protein